jgi:putative transposase
LLLLTQTSIAISSFTKIIYHIIFGTYKHKHSLDEHNRIKLFIYLSAVLKNKGCFVFKLNGTSNHIHFLIRIPPVIAVSSLVKDIKLSSTVFIKEEGLFPLFEGWQAGYSAFTCSSENLTSIAHYIEKQEEHHAKISFREEYCTFLKENGIDFDEKLI